MFRKGLDMEKSIVENDPQSPEAKQFNGNGSGEMSITVDKELEPESGRDD